MIEYLYFWGSVYFFIWWIFLFHHNREVRREMLAISVLGGFLGPLIQIIALQDWWHPLFIFNTPIKIEDVLFGFSSAGVSAVIYQELLDLHERKLKKLIPSAAYQFLVFLAGVFSLYGLFYIFDLHSFWSSTIAFLSVTLLIIIKRHDLVFSMFASGLLVTLIAIPFYIMALIINPLWFQQEWLLNNLSGIYLWNIPIEELTWYFFSGLIFSGLWEFLKGFVFIRKSKPAGVN